MLNWVKKWGIIEKMEEERNIISLQGVFRRYGYGDAENFALDGVDFEVKKGEFVMIMGQSGSGKTTLLNILGLLDKMTAGEYVLDGANVRKMSGKRKARARASKIGVIFQNFNLIPEMTVIENVALPLVYMGKGKTKRLKMASEVLRQFHLGEREYYMPHQLSGGQQQRVAIARALVGGPEIILADEPTGNLDSKTAHIVMEELKTLNDQGKTIVMVTHNAGLLSYATRVIKMLDGKIVEDTEEETVQVKPKVYPLPKRPVLVPVMKPVVASAEEAGEVEKIAEKTEEEGASEDVKNEVSEGAVREDVKAEEKVVKTEEKVAGVGVKKTVVGVSGRKKVKKDKNGTKKVKIKQKKRKK